MMSHILSKNFCKCVATPTVSWIYVTFNDQTQNGLLRWYISYPIWKKFFVDWLNSFQIFHQSINCLSILKSTLFGLGENALN